MAPMTTSDFLKRGDTRKGNTSIKIDLRAVNKGIRATISTITIMAITILGIDRNIIPKDREMVDLMDRDIEATRTIIHTIKSRPDDTVDIRMVKSHLDQEITTIDIVIFPDKENAIKRNMEVKYDDGSSREKLLTIGITVQSCSKRSV